MILFLGGGFKYCLFSSLLEEMILLFARNTGGPETRALAEILLSLDERRRSEDSAPTALRINSGGFFHVFGQIREVGKMIDEG